MLDPRHMRRRFEVAAAHFDAADFVHAKTRTGLFERLDGLTIEARTIVDLGSATGSAMPQLSRHFGRAQVVAVDLTANMLRTARSRKGWFAKSSFVQADATTLPLATGTVDVVFSNLLLPWINDPGAVFLEVARVLRKEGLFIFSTLGPDSFAELAIAWATVDDHAHINRFVDMHNLGDGLVSAGLRDPVLDVDRLQLRYTDSSHLFADLTASGARNALRDRPPGLMGRQRFQRMTAALEAATSEPGLALNLELVYGHCWGAGAKNDPQNWGVDAGSIPVRRR